MKHLWFGIGLLAALLVISLWLGSALETAYRPSAADLEKAADAALEEDWALASALYTRARKHWEVRRNLSAALVNHGSLDQIDIGFSRLEIYAARQEISPFCAGCAQLAQQLQGLPQPHGFTWWNLL